MRKGKRYWHDVVGYNFRLTNIQAALGCAQLKHLPTICVERARVHEGYGRRLRGLNSFREQFIPDSVDAVLWAFAGRIGDDDTPVETLEERRDEAMRLMMERGIETRPGFYALNSMPPYPGPGLKNARRVAASVISLPTYPGLSDATIERICDALRAALAAVLDRA